MHTHALPQVDSSPLELYIFTSAGLVIVIHLLQAPLVVSRRPQGWTNAQTLPLSRLGSPRSLISSSLCVGGGGKGVYVSRYEG